MKYLWAIYWLSAFRGSNPLSHIFNMIQIQAIGGYNEVGKNCTAVKIDNEIIILDMGIHLDNYINYTKDEDLLFLDANELIKIGAIPNINGIEKELVKAIIPTHAHLDHVGAIPYLANNFDCPIICTPFTKAVINAILKDEKIKIKNKIKEMNINSRIKIGKNIVEFINITHSTPQTVMVAIHTKYGIILYANDFKFDNYPILGKKPNYERLKEMNNVIALIVDSIYAKEQKKTPSETVAREMLKDVLLGTENKDKAIIVTTFSSHLARLKSIIEIGQKLNRKIILLGRSLAKYVYAGEEVGIIKFSDKAEIFKYGKQIKKELKKIEKNKKKYLIICTGNQGEPGSVLSKIANGEFKFKLDYEDHIIFSCKIIPSPINIKDREILENNLKQKGVRIFKDIHVSGHSCREDHRDLINMVKPKYIIPAHGNREMENAMKDLALEMGYNEDKVYILKDGDKITLQ